MVILESHLQYYKLFGQLLGGAVANNSYKHKGTVLIFKCALGEKLPQKLIKTIHHLHLCSLSFAAHEEQKKKREES